MLTRAVVNVATTEYYRKGQTRLRNALKALGEDAYYTQPLILDFPPHSRIPFAFKAFALNFARAEGVDMLVWADACILPVRNLAPVWEKIERDGYLLMNNGYSNATWTADSAYPDLFPEMSIDKRYHVNKQIKHVVGGFFGLSMRHEIGRAFLDELYRLAGTTRVFCGPTINANSATANEVQQHSNTALCAPCGPPDVKGHRHDQTAMSVIAWRLGMKLSDPPEFMIYGKAQDATDPRTIVVADGDY